MEALPRDLRQSIRALGRTPAFTAIAVGTVALGIAAVASMFAVASAALVRPLRFEDPGELYELRKISSGGDRVSLALPELAEWQLTLAAVVTLFGLISWSASVIPALRAASVDPSTVLRAD